MSPLVPLSRPCRERSRISRAWPALRSGSCRDRHSRRRLRRWLTSNASSSPTSRRPDRRWTERSASSKEQGRAERPSSSPARSPHCSGAAPLPSESRWCASPSIAGARRSKARFAQLEIPLAVEHARRLGETPLGRALLAILRYEWLAGSRGDLFAFLRSPFSGLERRSVDFVEGRLRGRAVTDRARVDEESEKLRGAPVPALADLRANDDPLAATRSLIALMIRNGWGLESPPTTNDARIDARAYRAAERTLDELAALASAERRRYDRRRARRTRANQGCS